MDGHPRDFRQVFQVFEDFSFIGFARPDMEKVPENAHQGASNWAWGLALRPFKGTTYQTPGATFPKDLAYLKGQAGIIKLAAGKTPEVDRFLMGKYDPLNPKHVAILDQLGIRPATTAEGPGD